MSSPIFRTYAEGELKAEDIRSGLKLVSLCGSFAFVWLAIAVGMPLTMFLEFIGASGLQIGMVVAAQQLPLALQIPAALVVERMPSRKPSWFVLALAHRVLWFVAAIVPFTLGVSQAAVWTIIAMVAVSFILGQMSSPMWQGWMADLVPSTVSARFWGVRLSVQMAFFLAAVWGSGVALDAFRARGETLYGFALLFGISAVFGTLDILLHLRVPEPAPQPPPPLKIAERFKEILKCRDFVLLTSGLCAWYAGVSLLGVFTPICLKRDFSMNYTEISLFIMTASLGTVLLGVPLGKLGSRFGSRPLCAICMFVAPALMLMWFFVSPLPMDVKLPFFGAVEMPSALIMMLPFQLISGGLYACVGLFQFHLAGLHTKREGRTLWMASHWCPIGICSAASPLLGGFLMDFFSAHPMKIILPRGCPLNFYHVLLVLAALIAWGGALLLLKMKKGGTEFTLEEIFRTMFAGNPFRAVMSSYGLLNPRHSPHQDDKK